MSDAKNSPIAPERYGHHGKAGTSVEGHGDAFVRQVSKLNFFVFVIKAKTCLRQHIQSNESGQGYSQFAFEARKIVDLHRQKLGPHGTEFDLGDDRSLRWDHLAGCAQSRSAGLQPKPLHQPGIDDARCRTRVQEEILVLECVSKSANGNHQKVAVDF